MHAAKKATGSTQRPGNLAAEQDWPVVTPMRNSNTLSKCVKSVCVRYTTQFLANNSKWTTVADSL